MNNSKKLFNISILSFIFFMLLFLVGSYLFQNQIADLEKKKDQSNDTIEIDWEDLFPYKYEVEIVPVKTDDGSQNAATTNQQNNPLISKAEKLSTLGNTMVKKMYKYSDIAKAGYIIDAFLTDPSVGITYIKLKNGYWVTHDNKVYLNSALRLAAPYASLQNYLKNQGKDFIFFYSPHKVCKYSVEVPDGVSYENLANENIDTALQALDAYGINYVDMREQIHNDNLDHYSLFYKTDHHWTIEAGLWAASVMAKEINRQTGLSMLDPQNIGTYSSTTYENVELGSMGRGVTKFVADPEDFTVLFPDFETNYRLEIPNLQVDETGSFKDIFIDYQGLDEVIKAGGGSAYGKVLYGNQPYEKITNYNNPNGPKILVIKDSFAIAVAPYLASSCSEMILLDTRPSNGNFNGSIVTCIEEFNPDVVLVIQASLVNQTLNK